MVFRAQTYTKIREFSQFADKKNNGKMSYICSIAETITTDRYVKDQCFYQGRRERP